MRHLIPVGALLIAVLALASTWLARDTLPHQPGNPSGPRLEARLGNLENSLAETEKASLERLAVLAKAQEDSAAMLEQMQAQLAALAQSGGAKPGGRSAAADAGSASDVEDASEEPDAAVAQASSGPPSEAQVGELMDRGLDGDNWDMNASELARSQAATIVDTLPGVNLADMVCNDKLCRATFIQLDGSKPEIDDIWGQPPFVNDGFSIEHDDGSVVLYFAQPGMDLDDVREQLIADRG